LTKLPLALSAGSSEKTAPVPALMLSTRPCSGPLRSASTSTVTSSPTWMA
jgi:hypothetical protein